MKAHLCAATAAILPLLASAAVADTIRVPQDQQTIGGAVGAAANGDVIQISKGTYSENVIVNGFNGLTIKAKGKVMSMTRSF